MRWAIRPRRPAVVAALVLVLAGAVPGLAWGDSGPRPAASAVGVSTGQNKITVLAQSPWVTTGQAFQLRLQISAPDPAADKLSIQTFSRLTTRTDFDNAMAGHIPGFVRYAQVEPLSQFQGDPAGGVDVSIPVDPSQPPPAGSLPAFSAVAGSGVFPLQVSLADANGDPLGKPLTTFLVYAAGDPSVTSFPRLSVGLVIPFAAPPTVGPQGQLQPVTADSSTRLSQLAQALGAHTDVPVSVAASPQTLDALTSGTTTDKATLAAIASLGRSSDQMLPQTYAPVSIDDMLSAGLGAELTQQVGAGASTLGKVFGSRPDTGAWVVNGPVDPATLGAVTGLGMNKLVVPDSDLSPLPASSRQTTFALPTKLSSPDKTGTNINVFAADPALSADFNAGGGSVLAATRLLAELSMIQVETPGLTRGVAVVPPARWTADATFVDTLLSGLSGHPLLQSVTVSGLFEQVKSSQVQRSLSASSDSSSGGSSSGGSASGGSSSGGAVGNSAGNGGQSSTGSNQFGSSPPAPAGLSTDAKSIKTARRAVDALQGLLPPDTPGFTTLVSQIQAQLLAAESNAISESQRQTLIAAVNRETTRELSSVTLPGSSSITLTATKGQIPLTILSAGGAKAKVQLRLSSQRLIFRAFDPGNGHCTVPTPTSETCELILAGQNTTIKVPVETRSSGVFPLDVSLYSAGGARLLALNRDTVRSTAVSNVGVILIVLAVASLA
ncbi:MAG TPA: DUF6049 family protein, partial [Acidimicrobiales bacterium]|nr:DUF6049 family protein [Acidimicrobiales bacterium]